MRMRVLPGLAAAVCLLFLAGCGSAVPKPDPTGTVKGFPYTVHNCGVTTTYRHPPTRAVTLNQHTTEIMLALGLRKSMVGTAYLDDAVLPQYRDAYDSVKVLAKRYPSQEALLSAEPDFVYGGFTSAFDESQGRGRAALAKDGINTHLSIENCPAGPVTETTDDQEILTIGRIFAVEDRAKALVASMHTALDRVRSQLAHAKPVKAFVYDSGERTAFTAGGAGIGNEILELAGGSNAFADLDKRFGDVSFEQVAQRAPDVIVIYDYGEQSVAAKKAFLLSNPALRDVPAIRHRHFAVLPLSSTVLGVRLPSAVESLARQLHPGDFR
ncbi:ABC transporter substrate-binding protein [Streptomyces sp. RPT161]|uniref:ABC transporter substrate-binding protein n=1 Tax=Streptomyces sp. RPT161 TaxID=3015993 RepID=UPI0022B91E4C|nr:ABC transporter substrate-binding protein [Streptomyces sp. RPT161]